MSPEPGDLWERLARLHECCDVQMRTIHIPDGAGDWDMRWRITISRRGSREPPVRVELTGLVEAITEALVQVGAREWHHAVGADRPGSADAPPQKQPPPVG